MTTITNSPNSVLVDNQKQKRVAYTFGQLSSNRGIDFSHDALIVSAKSKISESQTDEQLKDSAQDFAKMDEEHIQQEYQALLAQQQSQLLLRQMAQTSADNLVIQQESIFQQLLRSNSEVANLENQKSESESKIANYASTLTNLRLEKAGIVAGHDRNIGNYEKAISQNESQKELLNGQISDLMQDNSTLKANNDNLNSQNNNLNAQNSSLDTQISNLQGQISQLSAQITEDMPEDQKAQIQQQIASLEDQIKKCEEDKAKNKAAIDANNRNINANNNSIDANNRNINANNNSISNINANIANTQAKLDSEKAAKVQAIANYDGKISQVETNLANEQKNCEYITNKLAQAVYQQTGLTLENATLTQKVAEAQLFLTSIEAMLKETEARLNTLKDKLDKATKKREKANKEYNEAEEATDASTVEYQQTETKVRNQYAQKDEEQKQREFLG